MADRRSKSSGKHSVRVVASGPQQSSSAPTRRHIAFCADRSGRLQQSVVYSHPEEPVPDDDALPLLLEVMDDEDEDEATDDLADAMEDQFFGLKDQVVPEKSMGPDRPVQDWLPFRQEYVDEFLSLDGLGDYPEPPTCSGCGIRRAIFKCQDCFGGELYCSQCSLEAHRQLPLHRLGHWEGTYFADVTLQHLGLAVHLGHQGNVCPHAGPIIKNFTVVDVTGIHTINIHFCGCIGAPHARRQLLAVSWFPASLDQPQTAFTLDVLDTFQLLNLQGKISAYDFYYSLDHKTDNTGTMGIKDRYHQFLTAIRIYRHIKMLKQAGRGNDPEGVDATQPGDCAVECPACPHPGRNLPAGWEDAPENVRWLYCLILVIDANFRLKLKEKGIKGDPALGDGWGHWVSSKPYHTYIKKYGYQVEPNLCDSELKAVDHGHSKYSASYRSTGAGACLCGRHTLVRKNGLGDLQKGERYANIDFIFFSAVLGSFMLALTISYDICCQWSRNLVKRVPQLPRFLQISKDRLRQAKYVLPKFHIYNHGLQCVLNYSLNFLRWSAASDLEDPERWWAHINPVSMSTKEMSEGSRHDTIDDHARAWNWRKITGFGHLFLSRLKKALVMQTKHQGAFIQFNATFPPAVVEKWDKMVVEWDKNKSAKNPYEEPVAGTTMTEVRLELANEENEDAARGKETLHDVSPARWLIMALDLEEQQRVIMWQSSKKITTLGAAELQDKRHKLRRRIEAWREIQRIYMPCVEQLRNAPPATYSPSADSTSSGPPPASQVATDHDTSYITEQPETTQLFLPSSVPVSLRTTGCIPNLAEKERRLRLAQADDALHELRRQLRISATLHDYKRVQVGGTSQKMNTRTRSLLSRFHDKTMHCAKRYSAAFTALSTLDPNGDWTHHLKFLDHKKDLHSPRQDDDDPGESKRELSWIWLVPRDDRTATSSDEINDTMRVEWAKTKARADRWHEEVLLVSEEMRRVLYFFQWKAEWWASQSALRTDAPIRVQRGIKAYAAKQVAISHAMATSFAAQWYPTLKKSQIPTDWPSYYIPVDSNAMDLD